LKSLAREMLLASKRLQFERAAALRDQLEPLVWLHRRLAFLRRARSTSGVYEVSAHDGARWWYAIQRGFVRAVMSVPTGVNLEMAAGLQAVFSDRATALAPQQSEHVEGLILVASWFRKYPAERLRLYQPAAIVERCQTGMV